MKVLISAFPLIFFILAFVACQVWPEETITGLNTLDISPEEVGNTVRIMEEHNSIIYSISGGIRLSALKLSHNQIELIGQYRTTLLDDIATDWIIDDIAIAGDYAYLVGKGFGLQIIDISNPTEMYFIGAYTFTTNYKLSTIFHQDHLYINVKESDLSDTGHWLILDVTIPEDIGEVGKFVNLGIPLAQLNDHIIAIAETNKPSSSKHLQIIDVSMPQNPKVISESLAIGHADDGVLVESKLVLASGQTLLVDLSDLANPKIIAENDYSARSVSMTDTGLIIEGARSLQVSQLQNQRYSPIAKLERYDLEAIACLMRTSPPANAILQFEPNRQCPDHIRREILTYIDINDILVFENIILIGTSDVGILVFEIPS